VATPTLVKAGTSATARLTGSLFLVLALWLGAVAAFLSRRPVPPVLASSRSTWELTAATGRPAVTVAAVTGVVLGGGMAVYLGLGFGRSIGLVVVAVLVAVAFALVNQALVALLGVAGSSVGLVAVLLTAIVGLTSTSPSTVASTARLLPTHPAGTAFRAVTMGGDGLLGGVLALALWAGVAVAGTAWAIERRRRVPPRLLRSVTAT
jgi:putative membrane protein